MANAWTHEEDDYERTQAKKICGDCPVRLSCLLDARADRSVIGVRAGVYFYLGGFVSTKERKEIFEEFGVLLPPRKKARESRD